jgi:capsular exopolysaccharide synthesis family protein
MGKTYEALKRAEETRRARVANGEKTGWWRWFGNGGNGQKNGQKNGHKNGHGNGGNGQRNGEQRLHVNFDLDPQTEEAYQQLGTNMLARRDPRPVRSVLVAAARHGEGATTTAALFGSILVRRRRARVLILEANFRSPALEQVFAVQRNGGMGELVDGVHSLDGVLQRTQIDNLFVITCGHTPAHPSALFESPGVDKMLHELAGKFDYVIFDCPPINEYTDASILGPKADASVLVVESDKSRINEAQRAKRQLERVGASLLGVVLNRQKNVIPPALQELL